MKPRTSHAPDLLKAAKAVMDWMKTYDRRIGGETMHDSIQLLRAAITKAEGLR